MKTTKSVLALAQAALRVAQGSYAPYSSGKSPRKFSGPQRVACLAAKEFLRLDYRGIHPLLGEWSALRARQYHSQCREMALRMLTYNLMILWSQLLCSIQSMTVPDWGAAT